MMNELTTYQGRLYPLHLFLAVADIWGFHFPFFTLVVLRVPRLWLLGGSWFLDIFVKAEREGGRAWAWLVVVVLNRERCDKP